MIHVILQVQEVQDAESNMNYRGFFLDKLHIELMKYAEPQNMKYQRQTKFSNSKYRNKLVEHI